MRSSQLRALLADLEANHDLDDDEVFVIVTDEQS